VYPNNLDIGDNAELVERESWQPELARTWELTPLPEIEAAMPVLGIFRGLLGRRHASYKVGIVRDLAAQPGTRWRMRDIVQRADWLKPDSVRRLARELAENEVLKYDAVRSAYRLSPEARVVASFCRALTVSKIKHSRIIKALTAAIRAAQAIGAPDEAVFQPFLDAIAVLEEDFEEMKALIADYSEDALKLAAVAAKENIADMRDLLDHEEEFFGRFHNDEHYLEMADRAHRALTALADLTNDVWIALFEQADEILRRGLHFDRQDIREMVASLSLDAVAGIIPNGLLVPAQVQPADTDTIFAALAFYLGRPDIAHGLPEPIAIQVLAPATLPENDFRIAAFQLEQIAAAGGAPLADWVAVVDWNTAVRRMGAAVGAWGRYGPAGSGDMRAHLVPGIGLEEIGRAGVAMMSPMRVHPKIAKT
jgi:hypothetical protein